MYSNTIKSPCNNICKMNHDIEICEGCNRTLDEIIEWAMASDDRKKIILENIARRKSA